MSIFVVGDIQACYSGLKKLLLKVGFNPKQHKLWAVGDLIGRGPQALETIEFLMSLGDSFNTVLGNHDLHFLAVSQGIREVKGKDGFAELLQSSKKNLIIQWLREKPLAAVPEEGFFLSHAGLYPLWSEREALKLAQETSQFLKSDKWRRLLEYMYGNEEQRWTDNLSGLERHKFVIDAFTRMRFVDQKAGLNLQLKTTPKDAPPGIFPWFQHPDLRHESQLLFGHWAALEGNNPNERIHALDTGYIWGGKMTAINLKDLKTVSVKARTL
ncbi:symmetrical bis(5'-nucleosyl)-tetraphosphatase [Planctobacterium marinum]|uniref:bis(5'-nucleosyl)-tetraphosphatase (symmetrical) n=1 Tax=Planctobacterium marinum TaxID=1631968 RepID=A0AA48HMW4_9ALTE|nr:bis(5'-nucleosyl)-tetraphosphatase, symmetrical [Planctobacterium marinum]